MKNIILLTVDTLRKDVLGCYGNTSGLTPFLDSLSNKCLRFTKAQSVGPYTQASFPGILTSSYYLEYGREKKLSPQRTLISEVLQRAGIVTAGFHSNPYLCDFFGWNRGWDIFYDSMEAEVTPEVPYLRGSEINSKVSKWLSSHLQTKADRPFFLWLHYMDVHEPYVPERSYLNLVDSSIDLRREQMLDLFKNVILKRDVSNEQTVRLLKKLYDAHVRQVDDYIKNFFTILETLGLLPNCLIIITSDHGDEFAEHGGLSHDGKMYSELIDVPLAIYDDDKIESEACDTLVSTIDIPPTILHLFGLEPIQQFQGRSLLPGEDYPPKGCGGEAIGKIGHQEKETDQPVYFYRENDRKIIYRESDHRWQMYNLKEDPQETHNIIDTSVEAEEMKEKLRWRIRERRKED